MSQQLNFDLPAKPALGRDDFFVAPANQIAVALIENWQNWAGGKLLIYGPAGSGKTHLTHVWAAQSGARIVKADSLTDAAVPVLATGHVAVEDVQELADQPDRQTALFHLHNLTLAEGNRLLLTGRGVPETWGLSLPDLTSRIAGTHQAALEAPDDMLLFAVLTKLFSDRQISPRPDVIPYLVQRMDRSFDGAADIVDRLDKGSLSEKRNLTRAFAAQVLAEGDMRG